MRKNKQRDTVKGTEVKLSTERQKGQCACVEEETERKTDQTEIKKIERHKRSA